jgi:Fe-S cluster assembly protein SufD
MMQEMYLSRHSYPDHEVRLIIPSGVRMRVINQGSDAVERLICIVEDNAYVELVVEHVLHSTASLMYECILKRDAQLVYNGTVYGSSSAEYRLSVACSQPGAQATICLGYALTHNAHLTINTFQHHHAAHTASALVCKGIAAAQSYASYDGMIRIEQGAHHVCAAQENKTIIMGDHARAASIPNIEVHANDVQCTHASAVGRHDEEIIQYVRSRGLSEQHAQHLLLDAFLADVVSDAAKRKRLLADLDLGQL